MRFRIGVEIPQIDIKEGPIILKEEVSKVLNSLWSGKAPGDDAISTEMLRALHEIGLNKIIEPCNNIYDTGYMPDDM